MARNVPQGIPTIRDRVSQALMKNLLEPEWEAVFEANSYGFRLGRGCHDAIERCWMKLNSNPRSGGHKWVLDADIKGFFDNIAHESILTAIGSVPRSDLIEGWLKAGFFFEGINNLTNIGTPQGGVISPLLANIGLHGMEQFIKSLDFKLGFVRYADDFIITAKDKESLENVLPQLKRWLGHRGLELSDEKTKIVNIENGFDFLGFNLKQYNDKLLIKPQKTKVLAFCRKIGRVIKDNYTAEQESLIRVLNPLLRGFARLLQKWGEQRNLQLYPRPGMEIPMEVGKA